MSIFNLSFINKGIPCIPENHNMFDRHANETETLHLGRQNCSTIAHVKAHEITQNGLRLLTHVGY